ncbi:MAG TPA: transporter [Candidatus Limnocylindria bacterium]|nr:transporter [Candidatus Limnocylindria bacterium]
MPKRIGLWTALFCSMWVVGARAASLRDQLVEGAARVGIQGGSAFDALAEQLANTAARSIPVVSASAGFTYRYNADLEVFERTSQTLGPIYLERPDTLGRSKFNVSMSYQYVRFDEYDGDDLDSLASPYPIVTRVRSGGVVTGANATRLTYDLGLSNHVVGLSGTYGVLDDLDVNLLVPLIRTSFDTGVDALVTKTAPAGGAFTPCVSGCGPRTADLDGDAFGVGDILLRAKYLLSRREELRTALGLQLRLPSGDEDDFQGTGSFEISPAVYVSTLLGDRVSPHANLAIDIDTEAVSQSQTRYGIGIDADVLPRLGLSLAFLGRSEFSESASPSETDFQHLVRGTPQLEPLLGLDFGRNDYFDLSFGLRAVVWRDIMVFVNGLYALNDQGLRNDTIIPLIGVEGTF